LMCRRSISEQLRVLSFVSTAAEEVCHAFRIPFSKRPPH
jgi:hypothetical protein